MKNDIVWYEFRNDMKDLNWDYGDALLLWEYLEEYEDDTDEELDYDPIALNCEFAIDSLTNVLESYGLNNEDDLRDNTQVVAVYKAEDGIDIVIYQAY